MYELGVFGCLKYDFTSIRYFPSHSWSSSVRSPHFSVHATHWYTHTMVQPTHWYRSHNNIFRRVAIYDLNRFVGNPHIGPSYPLRRFQMRRNAWIPVRLSTATDAVLLRSHEANGAAVGWLPWVREDLCVSRRLALGSAIR